MTADTIAFEPASARRRTASYVHQLVPRRQQHLRKLRAFARVLRLQAPPVSARAYEGQMTACYEAGRYADTVEGRADVLWTMENLSYRWLAGQAASGLRRTGLPKGALPIAHTALGLAAVQRAGFVPSRLAETVERMADPRFVEYAFEAIGGVYGSYERGLAGSAIAAMGNLGLFARRPLRLPERSSFFGAFGARIEPLLSHGYGRFLYFGTRSLRAAYRAAERRRGLDVEACQRGITFAFLLINSPVNQQLLSAELAPSWQRWRRAWADGRFNTLAYLAWCFPDVWTSCWALRGFHLAVQTACRRAQHFALQERALPFLLGREQPAAVGCVPLPASPSNALGRRTTA